MKSWWSEALLYTQSSGLAEMDNIPVVIHIGLYKTGTSWIQKHVFRECKNIVYVEDFVSTHEAFLVPRFGGFSLDLVRERLGDYLDQAKLEGKPLLISDEGLSGCPFHQRFSREIVALRLRSAFPAAKLLITIREQDSVLNSIYGEYLRYGNCSTLKAFLAQNTQHSFVKPISSFDFYKYDEMIEFYESVFSKGCISMVPMEWILSDPQAFITKLEKLLICTLELNQAPDPKLRERSAWSGWSRAALRYLNRIQPHDSTNRDKFGRLSPNSIAYQIDKHTPNWARQRDQLRQKETVRGLVGNYYTDSNRAFSNRIEFDLEALGYRL